MTLDTASSTTTSDGSFSIGIMMLRLIWFTVVLFEGVYAETACSKAARAETYLETASDLIEKLRDNLPDGDSACACMKKPIDCSELLTCGHNKSGIYKIWPKNRIMNGHIDVFCDMESEGGGWTVIQKRGDYKRPADFFSRNWYKYKSGFGDLRKDFWLGNDNIYALTNQDKYYLLVDLVDIENVSRYAFYDRFWIDNEDQSYKLHAHDYSGDAGDSLTPHHGQKFSTEDKDNDNSIGNCAEDHKGGWWFTNCLSSNLNGLYDVMDKSRSSVGIAWLALTTIKTAEMKIRPSNFRMHQMDLGVEPA